MSKKGVHLLKRPWIRLIFFAHVNIFTGTFKPQVCTYYPNITLLFHKNVFATINFCLSYQLLIKLIQLISKNIKKKAYKGQKEIKQYHGNFIF